MFLIDWVMSLQLAVCWYVLRLLVFGWSIKYKQYIDFLLEVTTITSMGKEDVLSSFFSFQVTDIMR